VPEPDKNATTVLVGDKDELKQIAIADGKVLRTLKKHRQDPIRCVFTGRPVRGDKFGRQDRK
jgi:hypothetical protein